MEVSADKENLMAEDSVGRRNVLRGAGVAGGVALSGVALASPASAGESQGNEHLSGSWRVNVHNDDGDESVSILSFAAGQVCVVHDISPAGPPFTGTWRSGRWLVPGHRADRLRRNGPDTPGPVIELKLFGNVRHGQLSGSFTFRVTDPAGNEADTGSGTFDGERIEA